MFWLLIEVFEFVVLNFFWVVLGGVWYWGICWWILCCFVGLVEILCCILFFLWFFWYCRLFLMGIVCWVYIWEGKVFFKMLVWYMWNNILVCVIEWFSFFFLNLDCMIWFCVLYFEVGFWLLVCSWKSLFFLRVIIMML